MSKIVKNMGYAFFANIISILITIMITFFLPKIISMQDYSYWQLYMFYISYVCFFHLGWNDGIYLRYAGKKYEELDFNIFSSQFWMINIFEIMLTLLLTLFVVTAPINNKSIILLFSILNLLLMIPKNFVQLILQTTNRIQEYSKALIIEKILYVLFIFSALFFGMHSFISIIIAEILSKIIALIINLKFIKNIIFTRPQFSKNSFIEAKKNISSGSKLMIANTASMLILGVIKFGIEKNWDIVTFGKISLAISMSNILITFINVASVVIFPAIKQIDKSKLANIYVQIRFILMVILFGLLAFYFPGKIILQKWLPNYLDSIKFMAYIFPLCIFDSKVSILINTYLKALRKEKIMLIVNIGCVLFSILLTLLFTVSFQNLNAIMLSIIFIFAIRSIVLEIILTRYLKFNIFKDTLLEIIMVIIFIVVSTSLNALYGFLIYSFIYILYLIIKKEELSQIKLLIHQYKTM